MEEPMRREEKRREEKRRSSSAGPLLLLMSVLATIGCDENPAAIKPNNKAMGLLQPGIVTDEKANIDGEASDEALYRHPLLREGVPPEGLLPESPLRSADGRYFDIEMGVSADEEGNKSSFSGVVEVDSRSMSTEERSQMTKEKENLFGPTPDPKPKDNTSLGKLGSELKDRIADLRASDAASEVEVAVAVRRPLQESVAVELERAMVRRHRHKTGFQRNA